MPITQISGPDDFVQQMLKTWKELAAIPPGSEGAHYAKHRLQELSRLATETGNERAVRFMFREAMLAIAQDWRENNEYSPAELNAQAELNEAVRQTVRNGHSWGQFLLLSHHHHANPHHE
jgi:hypothetical protein